MQTMLLLLQQTMYAIVEWLATRSVSSEPSTWLVDDPTGQFCYWPPSSSDDRLIKQGLPPNTKWRTYCVCVMAHAGVCPQCLNLMSILHCSRVKVIIFRLRIKLKYVDNFVKFM